MKLKLLEMVLKALLELILDLVKKSAEEEALHDEEREVNGGHRPCRCNA